ncbi:hypothetical protein BDZ89DRAFT_1137423 [Hymenopellis radicata]|nr:hypothetical protein BDZ89DRAFT_1137423 [Hymenopellis radicata]
MSVSAIADTSDSASTKPPPEGMDWWNNTTDTLVDSSGLPLDVWAPGLCIIDPNYAPDLCAPDTTPQNDAIRGNWVRTDRNLNLEAGYMTGYLVSYHGFACRGIVHFPGTYTTGGRAGKMSRTSHSKDGTTPMSLYARALSNLRDDESTRTTSPSPPSPPPRLLPSIITVPTSLLPSPPPYPHAQLTVPVPLPGDAR